MSRVSDAQIKLDREYRKESEENIDHVIFELGNLVNQLMFELHIEGVSNAIAYMRLAQERLKNG